MSKYFILISVLVLITISVVFLFCKDFFPISKVATRISYSEIDSRSRGTWLCTYKPKEISINDTLKFNLISIFLEKRFTEYKSVLTVKQDSFQIKLVTQEDLVLRGDYHKTWIIKNCSYHGNGFVRKFDGKYPNDTIKFEVYKVNYEKPKHLERKLGEFVVTK
ncbi:hypothetical protein EYV94_27685 [Puteibacter caeruleilacunae]|nr:hypothetical protein EYV94_27685 [Puteibacter caeruleilacunae]